MTVVEESVWAIDCDVRVAVTITSALSVSADTGIETVTARITAPKKNLVFM